ncbi:VanZ family protein [Paenibacillus eucommiae]|uniref:Glycopeptide antibiotics resistance protein n=1 Tax=Paenibacillus eucommiae TaxID=1355755 RepID=A0ABS4IZL3_9BACL|nr:VanZ family protein [Paenibacillus eucommiae]MBP1992998.1 glycopeptide antibiotics resistance protein [Paenibacillus eucommiae]
MVGKLYLFKKIIVIAPFFLLILDLVTARYGYLLPNDLTITHISDILLNTVPLTIFVLIDTLRRKQTFIFLIFVQASFYIYVLSVFNLTIFPLSFENAFTNSYWIRRINIVPFNILSDYHLLDRQIIGNFIMLMPLGIYLHFLFKQFTTAKKSLFVIFLASFSIEITQLIFSAGSTDIDDIILNTAGGYIAFLLFKLVILLYKKNK